jgi:ankyrin repeat protein
LIPCQEADVNARNINGATPLHYAVQARNPLMIELLLKFKADPN